MLARAFLLAGLCMSVAAVGPAVAQTPGSKNADSIVRSLTPSTPSGSETRGIRVAKPGEVPRTAPRAASVSLNVEFASGSATLTPAAVQQLDELGRALADQRLAAYRFRIEGHTDTVGTPAYNKSLSQRRADTVASYLESKYQIDPTRLTAVGMGESGLLVATPAQTPELRNRRVLVVNIGS